MLLQSQSVVSVDPLQKVFTDNLNAENEKVLILSGADSSMISKLYHQAALNLNLDASLVISDDSWKLTSALEDLEHKNIVVHHQTKKAKLEVPVREFCKKMQHKFIVGSGITGAYSVHQLLRCMSVNHRKLREKQEKIREIFDDAKEMHVTTPAGTDLYLDVRSTTSISSHGIYDTYGSGGNLPGGEVYFAPKNAEGKVVVDVSSRNKDKTVLCAHPITLTVEKGKVNRIVNGINGRLLEETITEAEDQSQHPGRVRKLAEFGLGTHPTARVCGVTLIDEKVLGTAHIAIGSNHWFGGSNKTSIHVDQVFRNPTIEIDGQIF